jgi:threonine dehydrogenase-like Zn-dependent dehydrogenase
MVGTNRRSHGWGHTHPEPETINAERKTRCCDRRVERHPIMCCRKCGTISVPGVHIGLLIPFGAAMNKGLTFRMGQTNTQRYMETLLARSKAARSTRPSSSLTKRRLELYKTFRGKKDGCIKVVIQPSAA